MFIGNSPPQMFIEEFFDVQRGLSYLQGPLKGS